MSLHIDMRLYHSIQFQHFRYKLSDSSVQNCSTFNTSFFVARRRESTVLTVRGFFYENVSHRP